MPNRPLLQHGAQSVAVSDEWSSDGAGGDIDGLAEVPRIALQGPGHRRVVNPADADGRGTAGPLPQFLLRTRHAATGAHPDESVGPAQEFHGLVIVPPGTAEADVDDHRPLSHGIPL